MIDRSSLVILVSTWQFDQLFWHTDVAIVLLVV